MHQIVNKKIVQLASYVNVLIVNSKLTKWKKYWVVFLYTKKFKLLDNC